MSEPIQNNEFPTTFRSLLLEHYEEEVQLQESSLKRSHAAVKLGAVALSISAVMEISNIAFQYAPETFDISGAFIATSAVTLIATSFLARKQNRKNIDHYGQMAAAHAVEHNRAVPLWAAAYIDSDIAPSDIIIQINS